MVRNTGTGAGSLNDSSVVIANGIGVSLRPTMPVSGGGGTIVVDDGRQIRARAHASRLAASSGIHHVGAFAVRPAAVGARRNLVQLLGGVLAGIGDEQAAGAAIDLHPPRVAEPVREHQLRV